MGVAAQRDLVWSEDGRLLSIGQPEWLAEPQLQSLMMTFETAGFEIYAVGGCVRDTALGRPVSDVDLSTNAHPDRTVQIIEALQTDGKRWKAVPTGIDHGTVTALPPNASQGFEITTFRADVETDGRHAKVAFSDSFEQDALRRDFTINALYASRNGAVRDVVYGSRDLRPPCIRFIGDPQQRIKEDYLRILRFFRFTATHGAPEEGVDAEGLAACAMRADGLSKVSNERIGVETCKLVMAGDPAPIVGSMEHSGVLLHILPGASCLTLAHLMDLKEHAALPESDFTQTELAVRLAALGSDDLQTRLRLSNDVSRWIDLFRSEAGDITPAHELGFRHGFEPAIQCLFLRWASQMQPVDPTQIEAAKRGAQAVFPVSAADFMPAFTGKALGDRLRRAEAEWIASDFTLSKEALLSGKSADL